MRFAHVVTTVCLLSQLFCCGAAVVRAFPPAGGDLIDVHARAMSLVHQLGDHQYAVRQGATNSLVEMGLSARKALRQGSKSPNREIRFRSEQISATILKLDFYRRLETFAFSVDDRADHGLPGWKRFSEMVGSDAQARALFVSMQKAEPEIMAVADQGPRIVSAALSNRSAALQQSVRLSREQLSVSSIASLVFLAADPKVNVSTQTSSALYSLCSQTSFRTAIENGTEQITLRKLAGRWVRRSNGFAAFQGLNLAMRYDLTDGLVPAETILKNPDNQTQLRQLAVLTIAKLGDERHIPLLETLLADNSRTSMRRMHGIAFETQICDVALAALVHLTQQDHRRYGFAHLLSNPQQVFNPATLVFQSEDQRDEAIQRWREYRETQNALVGSDSK